MYLSRLELFGFKSFVDKIDIKFDPGITAVVGPNGCGKTNIVDAIRWVLGEQRASILRGSRMEDVIFNGTNGRKPLGMAEVSLTIENHRQRLPIEYSEVTIARRLFRSGESEYLLNRIPCRLKDIVDLFMDTGLGIQAYSIIEQDMVDAIIGGNPTERRYLLEEAAGINKYKTRRKLAERKLESTEQDLLRLGDIIEEVERQVASLYRQVRKARRYQRYSEKLKALEVALARQDYRQLQEEGEPLRQGLAALNEEKTAQNARLKTLQMRLETLRLELIERQRTLSARQQEVNVCNERIQHLNQDLLVYQERRQGLEERIQQATHEAQKLAQECQRLASQQRQQAEVKEALQVRIEEAEQDYRQQAEKLAIYEQTLRRKQEEARTIQLRRVEAVRRLTEKEGICNNLRTRQEELGQRVEQLNSSLKAVETELQGKEHEIASARAERVRLQHLLDDLQGQREQAQVLLGEQQAERDRLLRLKTELEAQIALLIQERDLLNKLQANYEGYQGAVRALLVESAPLAGLRGTVAELLKVEPAYIELVEAFLGEALQYLVVDSEAIACEAIQHLMAEQKGRATLIPLNRLKSPAYPDLQAVLQSVDGSGVGQPLADLVSVDPAYQGIIDLLLGHAWLVPDLDTALQLVTTFQTVVQSREHRVCFLTPEGTLVKSDGTISGGQGGEGGLGLLSRRHRITDLEVELKAKRQAQEQLIQQGDQVEAKRTRQIRLLAELEAELGQYQQRLFKLEQRIGQSAFEGRRLEERRADLVKEQRQAERTVDTLVIALEQTQAEVEALIRKREQAEAADTAMQRLLEEMEANRQRLAQSAQEARINLTTLQGKASALETTQKYLQERLEATQADLVRRHEEAHKATERTAELALLLQQGEAKRKRLHQDRTAREERRNQADTAQRETQVQIRQFEQEEHEVRGLVAELQNQIHSAELRDAELYMKGEEIRRLTLQKYQIDIEAPEPLPVPADFEAEQAQVQIEQLNDRISQLGPVNLAALEEYDEVKGRLDFLVQQRDDLLAAKDDLDRTILKMNRAARALFLETFEQVRQHFHFTFRTLFEGGEADLLLDQEADPLEANIEIMARPHGKRLQSINLLSSGETVLTAIALLFAIYLVKPSPFCILDEVDAPLDDANIQRFVSALRTFSANTQFIIVTHNKLTMEASDNLYGVTMEEVGVSKLVSVKLEEAPLE